MYGTNLYNPYHYGNPSPILPQQQVIQVNGKASIDTLQLAPNSSLLAMDTSAPIVWLCVSDGIGKVTSTAYDIVLHQEKPPVDMSSIEQRLMAVESSIAEMEGKINAKQSNFGKSKSKQDNAESIPD